MIIAYWCVLVAGILPILCSYIAKYGGNNGERAFDNGDPRGWLRAQTGLRARADAAQANSFEAFPLFAVGVVIAVAQHVPIATIDLLAVVFVAARVLYIVCYVADQSRLRSPVWVIGFFASVGLYVYASSGTLR